MNISVFRIESGNIVLDCVLDDIQVAYFTRSWSGVGDFSLEINYNAEHASCFEKGRVAMFNNDVQTSGIITEINRIKGPKGKADEKLVVRGFELKYIFSRRIIEPPSGQVRYLLSSAAETVIKTVIDDQCGPGATASRQMPELRIDTDNGLGSTYELSSRWGKLSEALENCSLATGLGYWVELDTGLLDFVLKTGTGTNRVASQTTNPRAIFSDGFNTLYSASAKDSDVLYRNLALVAGKGEGLDRAVDYAWSGTEPTGLDRREMFVDARDLDTGLEARGLAKLAEAQTEVFLDGRALQSAGLQYKRDYQLGDLCTVEALGQAYDARLTEVRENWGVNLYQVDVTFGRPYPELPRQVAERENAATEKLNANEAPANMVGYDANGRISVNGVIFPATDVPSTDPNTLDDYQEGTWTLGITFGGGSTGLTTSTNSGTYTKIGNRVIFDGTITLTNKGSSTGTALITGLPFSGSTAAPVAIDFANMTYTGMVMARTSGASITLAQCTEAGTRSALTATNFTNTTTISVSGEIVV